MTLRARMLVAFVYVLLVATITLSVPLAVTLVSQARATYVNELITQAEQLAREVPEARAGDALPELVTDERALARITVMDARGRLEVDSDEIRTVGRDYTDREEVRRALRGVPTRLVRRNVDAEPLYVVAVPVIDEGQIAGVVRLTSAFGLAQLIRDRLLALALVDLVVVIAGVAVAVIVSRSLTRPLGQLVTAARRMGEGDLSARAPSSDHREVADVAAALNSMTEQVSSTLEGQANFLATVSHQLRTPLTGLRLRLESLVRGHDENAARAALAETDRLSDLVSDLLALLRATVAPDTSEPVDANRAVEEAFDRWSVQAADDGHRLEFTQDPLEPHVIATADDIAIIFDNLIENALKYTPSGTTITAGVASDGRDVVLRVVDTGPGISPMDRERVFERFARGSAGPLPAGTGLGLAIVKEVTQRWHGAVGLGDGPGTEFIVRLPRAPADMTSTLRLDLPTVS